MKLTAETRKLLRERELLPGRLRKRLDRSGLFCTMDLLDELLTLFWDLNTRLEQIDKEQEVVASEINKDPKADPVWPDVATTELFAATRALAEVLKTIGERELDSQARSIPLPDLR